MNELNTDSNSEKTSSAGSQLVFIVAIIGVALAASIPFFRAGKVRVVEHSNVRFKLNGTSSRCIYDIGETADVTTVDITPSENYPFQFTPGVEWEAKLSDKTSFTLKTGLEFNWDMEKLTAFENVENWGKPESVDEFDACKLVTFVWHTSKSDREVEVRLLFQIRTKNDNRILIEKRHRVKVYVRPNYPTIAESP